MSTDTRPAGVPSDEAWTRQNVTPRQALAAVVGDWRVAAAIARNVPDGWADVLLRHPAPAVRDARRELMAERAQWERMAKR